MNRGPRAETTLVKRVAAAVIALVAFAPVGDAVAAPDDISASAVPSNRAERIGNATQTAAPKAPAPTPTVPSTPGDSTQMQQVLDLVNVERTSHGLVPVQFASQLNAAALGHTQRQAADGDIYHVDPDGFGPGDRISRAGYAFSTWGENVAAGQPTPTAVMQAWMNSEGHCKNILNPAFTELGVGYVSGGQRYNHFWTQNFARPAGVARPAGTYNPAWC